jgi:hypothetical protein
MKTELRRERENFFLIMPQLSSAMCTAENRSANGAEPALCASAQGQTDQSAFGPIKFVLSKYPFDEGSGSCMQRQVWIALVSELFHVSLNRWQQSYDLNVTHCPSGAWFCNSLYSILRQWYSTFCSLTPRCNFSSTLHPHPKLLVYSSSCTQSIVYI